MKRTKATTTTTLSIREKEKRLTPSAPHQAGARTLRMFGRLSLLEAPPLQKLPPLEGTISKPELDQNRFE